MSVRQVDSTADANKAACNTPPGITIAVKPTHQPSGDEIYATVISVTNSSDSPITLTGIQLVAQGVRYEHDLLVTTVPVRSAYSLDAAFFLGKRVNHIFKEPAEFRLYYSSQGHEQVACTTLVGE